MTKGGRNFPCSLWDSEQQWESSQEGRQLGNLPTTHQMQTNLICSGLCHHNGMMAPRHYRSPQWRCERHPTQTARRRILAGNNPLLKKQADTQSSIPGEIQSDPVTSARLTRRGQPVLFRLTTPENGYLRRTCFTLLCWKAWPCFWALNLEKSCSSFPLLGQKVK